MRNRLRQLLVVFVIAACGNVARAETLPGLIGAEAFSADQAKAAGQKADAQAMVRRNAKTLGYSRAMVDQALKPAMVRSGVFVVSLRDGTQVEFPWYRIGFAENRIANTGKISAADAKKRFETNKGGVRLHRGVFADEVYALALKMDTKLAITRDAINGHRFRGAKGGIGAGRVVKVGSHYASRVGDRVDPAAPIFDRAEIMRKFADSYRATGGAVGPGLDVQAGDVNTKAPEMKVLATRYGSRREPSAGVSGKAVMHHRDGSIDPRGGIEYRGVSTGDGVWMSARLAAHRAELKVRGATVVAQGWGEVGKAFGLSAVKDGARLIAIQEVWNVGGRKVVGTLMHPLGKNAKPAQIKAWLKDIDALRRSNQDLLTYGRGKLAPHFHEGLDVSGIRADIVGLNALGNVLTKSTVPAYVKAGTHRGKRKIVVEGANLAETAAGAKLIDKHRSHLLVIPGDLANLGGVHVSNLEAAQNSYKEVVSSERAKRSLLGTVRSGWQRAMKIADSKGVSERKAIELAAVDGMLKRSLRLPGAPTANIERRVISRLARQQRPTVLGELGKLVKPRSIASRVPISSSAMRRPVRRRRRLNRHSTVARRVHRTHRRK